MRKRNIGFIVIAVLGLILCVVIFNVYFVQDQSTSKSTSKSPILSSAKVKQKKAVTLYSLQSCPYCVKAKNLLDRKGVSYREIEVNTSQVAAMLRKRTGGLTSVPQIFVGTTHIGGYTELRELDLKGQLDRLLLGIVD